jgi:N6-adenosine-specific RNA methylase IME4
MIITQRRPFVALIADPPWSFTDKLSWGKNAPYGAAGHYSTMTIADIRALPVAAVMANPSLCALWCPSALLREGLSVLDAWGFAFKQTWVWVKTTKRDPAKLAFGVGRLARNCHEVVLVGTRGSVKPAARNLRSAFLAPREIHSAKPPNVHQMVEALIPSGPWIELFARQRRAGWVSLGNECGGQHAGDLLTALQQLAL